MYMLTSYQSARGFAPREHSPALWIAGWLLGGPRCDVARRVARCLLVLICGPSTVTRVTNTIITEKAHNNINGTGSGKDHMKPPKLLPWC